LYRRTTHVAFGAPQQVLVIASTVTLALRNTSPCRHLQQRAIVKWVSIAHIYMTNKSVDINEHHLILLTFLEEAEIFVVVEMFSSTTMAYFVVNFTTFDKTDMS
jgi:hypothetical protein